MSTQTKSTTTGDPDYLVCPFVILIDSREQAPFSFRGFVADAKEKGRPLIIPTKVVGLQTGDYTIEGCEGQIAIERKSLQDLYSTIGQGRERFERELDRLNKLDHAAVVIECSWPEIVSRECWRCHGKKSQAFCVQGISGMDVCPECHGTGRLHPVEHSRLSPKAVFRSINAWELEFPRVHWNAMGSKVLAEHKTFRLLERFWRVSQEKENTE